MAYRICHLAKQCGSYYMKGHIHMNNKWMCDIYRIKSISLGTSSTILFVITGITFSTEVLNVRIEYVDKRVQNTHTHTHIYMHVCLIIRSSVIYINILPTRHQVIIYISSNITLECPRQHYFMRQISILHRIVS